MNDPDRIRPAIAGALVANLNVDREFIPALEAAFGRAMHAVVLHDTALAAEIFQTLTENKSGQAALAIPEWSADFPDADRQICRRAQWPGRSTRSTRRRLWRQSFGASCAMW